MDDRVKKWLTRREVQDLERGEVPNMGVVDVRAALEGQAEDVMRGYSKRLMWWELEEKERNRL